MMVIPSITHMRLRYLYDKTRSVLLSNVILSDHEGSYTPDQFATIIANKMLRYRSA